MGTPKQVKDAGSIIDNENDVESLAVPLTTEDRLLRGDAIAANAKSIDDKEAALSLFKSKVKACTDKLQSETDQMALELRQGFQFMDVPIVIERDFGNGTITLIRQDTMQRYSSRKMSEKEKQRRMKL